MADALEYSAPVLDSLVEGAYSFLASFIWLSWDACICLGEEVEYVWKLPNSRWVKWFYLFTRYYAIVLLWLLFMTTLKGTNSLLGDCRSWFIYRSVSTSALFASGQLTLMTRVYALYNESRAMFYLLATLFVIECISVVPFHFIFIPHMRFSITCTPYTDTSVGFMAANVGLSFVAQCILMALTAYKTVRAIKSGWGRTPIVTVLLRDGTWAFALQSILLLVNVLMSFTAGPVKGSSLYNWLLAALAFSSCRLVLNLSGLNEEGHSDDASPSHDSQELTTCIEVIPLDESHAAPVEGRLGPDGSQPC